MNRKNKKGPALLVVGILCAAAVIMCLAVISAIESRPQEDPLQPVILYIGSDTQSVTGSSQEEFTPPDDTTPDYVVLEETVEMRAVWVAYMSLYNADRAAIERIVADCKAMGANAIIFHVRPFGDALYPSQHFPWSHILTETQGQAPSGGFDPLQYAIDCAHANGMQLHAWVNPLRIQMTGGNLPDQLSADNPYNVWRTDSDPANDCWVVDYNGGKFYNAGEEGARSLIVSGMAEIAANYNVDGLHWDDYFYPAEDESFDDSLSYENYLSSGGTKGLTEWRTENINTLVREVYNAVKAANSNCLFGISPAGNIGNCLAMGADVYTWGSQPGYVDYLCPQIYWATDFAVAPFEQRCREWRALVTEQSVDFYVGLALYKAGTDADGGLWLEDDTVIAREIEILRSGAIENDGFMIFSYKDFARGEALGAVEKMREAILG